MSTNPQENLNWPEDRHCLRRRPHPTENGRIHRRNRRANVGPDILELKMDEMNGKAASNWAKEGTGAPLSMNRKKRWELLEADEFPQFQKPERGIRVSKVVQRVNPLGRGIGLGKEGGRLEEENVLEMSSKGGNGRLVEKRSASGRGANKLAQWFQHSDRPKKGRNRRRGRGLEGTDGEEGKPLWMDLFGEEEEVAGKKKKSGRNRAEEKEGALGRQQQKEEGVHFYYTLKCQMVTPHQMDSGWQYRKQNPQMRIDSIQEEAVMEKKFIRRNNFGRKSDSKMGQEYFEEIDYSDIENEDSEMELEILRPKLISNKNKRISREFQMAENVEQKRPKNWWLNEIGPNIIENEEEKNEELVEMDWKLEEQIEKLEKCKMPARNLPIGSAIYEGEKIKEIIKEVAGEIPNGALIIRRNGKEKIKWFINLAQNEENEVENSTEHLSKKRRILDLSIQSKMSREKNKKIRKYLSRLDQPNASKSEWPANENSAEFFRELLRTRDKKHQLDLKLAENWPIDEEEAAQKALSLFFDEHKMAIRQKGEGDSAFGSEESQSDSENGPNFCEVCFAECNDATEGFGLPECREGPAMSEHLFCNGCWQKHIKQCLADGKVPIGCMEPRCPSILHPDCALLVVGQSTAENYRRLLIERRQMRNDFLHCQKCGQLNFMKELDESGPSNLLTICQNCAETICAKCGRRQHLPLKCVQRDLYEHILRANGQSLEYLVPEGESNVATGVRCTKCRNLVEKNQGCDHMTCRCGFQFCWRCGGDWLNHRQCQTEGQITIPLFDNHIFLNPKTGLRFRRMPRHVQVLAKFPEKFLGEYAKIRGPRERNGVKLFLEMEKIFAGNIEEAEKWTVKYMQLSEFVELAMVKSKLAPRNDPLKKSGERLLLNFTSLLIMGNGGNERVEISGEMIESGYTEMLAMCRQMVK